MGRGEFGDEFVLFAGIGQAHMGDVEAAAPGAALDDKAWRARRDRQKSRRAGIGADGADAVLGGAPGHAADEPRAGRDGVEGFPGRLGHGGEVDDALFQAEGLDAGEMQGRDVREPCGFRQVQQAAVGGFRGAIDARAALVAIRQAERFDLEADVVDLQHGRLGVRMGDVAAGFSAALDEAALDEFGDRLVHRHARALVLLGQLVLEGNAMAGRPFAREDFSLHILQDAAVQRRLLAVGRGLVLFGGNGNGRLRACRTGIAQPLS